jgi:hypothetical protein
LPHFSFDFKIQADEAYYETRKQPLASIVAERKELIHHLLLRYRFQSDESFIECGKHLDEQYEIKYMKELGKNFIERRKEVAICGMRLPYRLSPGWELSDHKKTACDEDDARSFPAAKDLH